ncbi:glyoxalase/bleomycin resistance/dioxygenase family protein [Bacillus obstructivus]|uniref:VOC family protein n=1 Tax=Heyndrickxia oleronia TaxID=38875 RepID=UPI0009033F61|nr:VOC family protein [Bacillus sp. Gen3]OJH20100.1 glyoxalase/bleomycin resistance/dioxygenase family protein [Bacillus obstructivus]
MYRWDGGFIMVDLEEFENCVNWYQEILGWECVDKITSWVGRKGFMKLPKAGMVTIKSFEGEYEHLQSSSNEGQVKLVFVTYDLDHTLSFLERKDVKFTETNILPNGQRFCDIFAFNDARLTLVEDKQRVDTDDYPESGILGFGNVNSLIYVKDPKVSAEWYAKNLGFEVVEVNVEKGYAHLRTEDAYDRNVLGQQYWDNIWLLQSMKSSVEKPSDHQARSYFDIRPAVFFEEYNKLIRNGIKPSEIAGDPINGWGGFHIYDSDNNRINIWSYK